MRYPTETLRQLGWAIGAVVSVINYCGHPNTYMPQATGAWFRLVPARQPLTPPSVLVSAIRFAFTCLTVSSRISRFDDRPHQLLRVAPV